MLELSNMSRLWSDSISELKQKAMNDFISEGIPTPKHENWKYLNLAFLNDFEWTTDALSSEDISDDLIKQLNFNGLDANLIVFVNGRFEPKFSSILDSSIRFEPLANLMAKDNNDLLDLGEAHNECCDSFLNLNTALFEDGAAISILKNCIIEKPIHILNINKSDKDLAVFPRNIIQVGQSSQVRIIETFNNLGASKVFSNGVSELIVGENANVDFYHTYLNGGNNYSISKTYIRQERNSVYNDVSFYLDGVMVRNNLYTKQAGENIETHYYGFYFADDKNIIDNHTFVDHAKPNNYSNEVYKGILDKSGTAIFNGKILVRPDAQKTNAYQSNKNVLLSDNAVINTKPELEIYADDVKCSHGATSGSLDKEHLFYLRARGIDEEKAKALLLSAFGEEIIEKIRIEAVALHLSDMFENKLMERL